MATLISTSLDVASQVVTATVSMTVQTTATFQIKMTQSELLSLAHAASRTDWNTDDVCSFCSTAMDVTVAKATTNVSNATA
jgi:hypothetical protein